LRDALVRRGLDLLVPELLLEEAMLARVSVLHRFIVTASDAGIPSITGNRLE
jgi:hypothetical protein